MSVSVRVFALVVRALVAEGSSLPCCIWEAWLGSLLVGSVSLGIWLMINIWEFPKIGVPYLGVLIIRILLFRVLY